MEERTSSTSLREVQRAEHVVAAKVDAFNTTERLELIKQILEAEEIDVKALGRCAVLLGTPVRSEAFAVCVYWHLQSHHKHGCIDHYSTLCFSIKTSVRHAVRPSTQFDLLCSTVWDSHPDTVIMCVLMACIYATVLMIYREAY